MVDIFKLASSYGNVMQQAINITSCCEKLSQEGYLIFPAFYDFVSNYGGVFGWHAAYKKKGEVEKFFIDPSMAVDHIFIERVHDYMKRCGCNLIPIGECSNGYITLMYGEDGAIYGGSDDYLWEFGEDVTSSIDVIINGKDALEIP